MSGTTVYRYCDSLIAAAESQSGLAWPFKNDRASVAAVSAELQARGYQLVKSTRRDEYFAEKVEGKK